MKGRAVHDNEYDDDNDNDDDDNIDYEPADIVEAVNEDRRQRTRVEAFEQLNKNMQIIVMMMMMISLDDYIPLYN